MKKLIYLIVLIVILGLIVTGCIPVVPPTEQDEPGALPNKGVGDVFYVPTSDYPTIQDAINAATGGETIIVAAGTYTNDIWDGSSYRITKSVTLLGAQAGNDPAGSTADRVGGETILVRTNGLPYSLYASDIIIDGFMFGSADPNTGGRLIISDVADNAIIRNCIIQNTPSGSSGHGVYIYPGAGNALIEYNTFYNTDWEAIRCDGNAVISNNTIKDILTNKGIYLGVSSSATVSDNVISNTYHEGIQACAYATITGNEISGCYKGIQVRDNASGSFVSKNTISNTANEGIEALVSATITGNEISECLKGIQIGASASGSTIIGNTISNTTHEGIQACAPATITSNEISGCYKGIQVRDNASGSFVSKNTISNTANEGIEALVSATIIGNEISGCYKGIGIQALASGSFVSANTISNTTYEGIQVFAPATITGNEISECYHGIQIRNHATGTIIEWNNIHDNTYHGIEIPNSSETEPDVTGVTITNNTFANNGYTGITVGGGDDGSGINIQYNSFKGNVYFGVESKIDAGESSSLYVNAINNWWGHPSGPGGIGGRWNAAGTKIIGKGDAVSLWVNWDPWLSQPIVPAQIANKWDLKGTFVAHSGYNWGGLAEGATWEYSIHIKEAINGDFSAGTIHFSTGDINVIGIVEQTKSDYAYWAGSNLAAAGRAEYNDVTYNFLFLYSERAIWFTISQADLEPSWSQDTVWDARAYQLHSKVPDGSFIMDPKYIH